MENRGLLFIPDISGFTRFVTETEIEHSRLIIQELLEILINSNKLELQISEIEGDAILFYKPGESPSIEQIYDQVAEMFCAFHSLIGGYERRRFCQCEACRSAINLSLKVITHYGEFTGYQVKNFNKLIGKDVIVAHQLLKNDIDQHEYWLVTNPLIADTQTAHLPGWVRWNSSAKQTETGEIPFRYTQLGPLKNELKPDPLPDIQLSKKKKVLSATRDYDGAIIAVFHATGDYNYRAKWQEGIKSIEEVTHFLPRLGMRCKCIMENGEETVYASSYYFHPERIEFSETDEKTNNTTYYTLVKTGHNKTRLTIDYYIQAGLVNSLRYNLFRKKRKKEYLERSMQKLQMVINEIKIFDEE